MAKCVICGESLGLFGSKDGKHDYCRDMEGRAEEIAAANNERAMVAAEAAAREAAAAAMLATTSVYLPDFEHFDTLGIVAGETVAGINVLKEVAVVVRDVVGGRSETLQMAMRSARESSLLEMKREAAALGAEAVIGVQLTYGEAPSGRPGSMLLVVATGTAIRRRALT